MKLSGRVAVVTGAGRGIGREVSLALAREGAALVLAARTPSQLAETATAVESQGGQALVAATDVSVAEDVDRLVRQALLYRGHIDILVNAAGIQSPIGPLVCNDPAEWMHTVAVNLFGTMLCCKAVLPGMIAQRRGVIVNFSGGGATGPRPNFSAYAASKAAVVRFTETLAQEVTGSGVRVNAIAPGAVDTAMLDQVLQAGTRAGEEELLAARQRKAKGGTPARLVADLVIFLASDQAADLSGKLISAPHDDWCSWTSGHISTLMRSPWYTLRRLDPFTIRSLEDNAP